MNTVTNKFYSYEEEEDEDDMRGSMTQKIKRIDRSIARFDKDLKEFLMFNKHNQVIEKVLHSIQDKYYRVHRFDEFTIITPRDMGDDELLWCGVAHTDTVSAKKPTRFEFNDGILSNPDGVLGADDRAGCWLISKLIEKSTRAIFILTDLEEVGGIGAEACAKIDAFAEIADNITALIEFDRRGGNDCAMYGYDNEELLQLFKNRGYVEEWGSYTDVVSLAEASGIACINLSVGYDNEHTKHETLNVLQLGYTTDMMMNNLPPELYTKVYKADMVSRDYGSYSWREDMVEVCCEMCNDHSKLYIVEDMMLCGYCAGFGYESEYSEDFYEEIFDEID